MSLYAAAYDIVDGRRRRRVARVLALYGRRVQYSLFEIFVEAEEMPVLRQHLGAILAREDRFDLFPIDERGDRRRVSWQQAPDPWEPVVML